MKKLMMRAGILAALMTGVWLPGGAWASSYAVSYNTITGFTLAFGGGVGNLTPFTFSVDASVTDYGLDGGISAMDAPAACVPASCVYNNSFTSHGSGTEYAYDDAQILNSNVQGGVGAASSIGEISAFNSIGLAGGSNTMVATFSVIGSGTVGFNFNATPYMNAMLTTGGVSAKANQLMSVSINKGLFTNVFEWKPDGTLGNAIGGTESADPFTLNSGLSGNASFGPGSDNFAAATNSLSAGTYTLKITMANYVSAAAVPVPAAVWLFGSGLLGLIGIARRKNRN